MPEGGEIEIGDRITRDLDVVERCFLVALDGVVRALGEPARILGDLVRQVADQVVDVLQFRLIKFGEISDEVILRIFRQELRHELAEDVEARFGEVHRQ